MFLKHWNLYDALYYSSYMMAKLKMWKMTGEKDLKRLIAKMGIPLD